MSQKWTSRLVQDTDDTGNKIYRGILSIAGFPYRITVSRDWQSEAPTLNIIAEVEQRR
jgi:hypothetical protein